MLAESTGHNISKVFNTEVIESAMLEMPQAECPVVHHFGPGIYVREVTLPAGTMAVGHTQRFEHMNIMLTGKVAMLDEHGQVKTLVAPMIFVGQPGRKVGYVLETCVWQNIYPNPDEIRDIDALESKWLDKSPAWVQRNIECVADEVAARQEDRDDFARLIAAAGFTPEIVRQQSENLEDQILMPPGWPKVTVRDSAIEGKGVFLSAPVEEGETIAPARIGGMRTPVGRFTNHSKNPNAEFVKDLFGDIYLVATRRIAGCLGGTKGEEVTVDYRQALSLSGIQVIEGEQQ